MVQRLKFTERTKKLQTKVPKRKVLLSSLTPGCKNIGATVPKASRKSDTWIHLGRKLSAGLCEPACTNHPQYDRGDLKQLCTQSSYCGIQSLTLSFKWSRECKAWVRKKSSGSVTSIKLVFEVKSSIFDRILASKPTLLNRSISITSLVQDES